jgi:hypothetical protein
MAKKSISNFVTRGRDLLDARLLSVKGVGSDLIATSTPIWARMRDMLASVPLSTVSDSEDEIALSMREALPFPFFLVVLIIFSCV